MKDMLSVDFCQLIFLAVMSSSRSDIVNQFVLVFQGSFKVVFKEV